MSNNLERYRELRAFGVEFVGKKLIQFIADNYSKELVIPSAKKLGMLEGKKTIACDDERDTDYIFDFAINEIKIGGKSAVQLYKEKISVQDEKELEFMEAIENSYTSLFRVVNTSPEKGLVFIKNLLYGNRNIRLTDISLSQTGNNDLLLFTRIYPFKDMNITSGMIGAFDAGYEMKLIVEYEKSIKNNINSSESEARFLFLYDAYKIIGTKTMTQQI